jgi:hypothetical protein
MFYFFRYLGIRVPWVPSLRSSTKKKAKGTPHTNSQGQVQSRGTGSPRGMCPHTGSPLKSLTQMAFEPTPDEGVTRSSLLLPHYWTSPVLHGCSIDRSEPTRQHEVKAAQRDDGHAKLANAEIISQHSSLVPSSQARFLLPIREHAISWLVACNSVKQY